MDAASSEEDSWDNREAIHVCQADLTLSHFPLALECRNRAEKYMAADKAAVRGSP
jgi:hypothetical protein